MGKSAYITKAAKFLPNRPVESDDIEKYLGMIGGKPSRAKSIILRQNQIKKRYYAIGEDGEFTHTNAQLTAKAISLLFDENHKIEDVDALYCGTSSPDQILPSHAVMVHGEIDNAPSFETACFSGVCCSGAHAIQYAYVSILSGLKRNVICAGSELASATLHARNFTEEFSTMRHVEENPIIAFDKDFIRFMLSDGAGAFYISDSPCGLSLKIDWMESVSFANLLPACMYQGAVKKEDGGLIGWRLFEEHELLKQSVLSLKQDTRLLGENVILKSVEHIKNSGKKHDLDFSTVDYFLPHISSMYFYPRLRDRMIEEGVGIAEEKWFLNLPYVGNVGSASIYLMVEELFNSGKLRENQKIYLFIPESGRFSYTTALLTVTNR
jgi:3-oxoacyl-[acyl-carrier-protein] synthase-3